MNLNEIIHNIDQLLQEYGWLFLEEHMTYMEDFRNFLQTLLYIDDVGKLMFQHKYFHCRLIASEIVDSNLYIIQDIHNIIAIHIMHIMKLIKLYRRIINKTM